MVSVLAFLNLGPAEIILVLVIPFVLFIIPFIFYILTLQATLSAISIKNRRMPPSNVWLLLIPVFGLIWHFVVVKDLASSISDEAVDRNIRLDEPSPAYNIGLGMCILNCLIFIPLVGIAALVLWIMYWVKISGYRNQLLQSIRPTYN